MSDILKEAPNGSTSPTGMEALLNSIDNADAIRGISTDLDRAKKFAETEGDRARFVPESGSWIIQNENGTWAQPAGSNLAATTLAMKFAERTSAALFAASERADEKASKELAKQAASIKSSTCIKSIVELSKAVPGMTVPVSSLNANPNLIGTRSGVLDLRTGTIISGPCNDYVTLETGVNWDPDAKCPTFDTFLRQMMSEEMDLLNFMVQWLGYTLTGDVSEQKFVILYGARGRNGKGALFDVLENVLGPYAWPMEKGLLTQVRQKNSFSLSTLDGIRLAFASETSSQAVLDVEFIKAFVAGDSMFAEKKGQQGYKFNPQAKLMLALNTLPFATFDSSFRSRVIPIPLQQSFYPQDHPLYRDGDLTPDPEFKHRLAKELPGILALMVKGFQDWRENRLTIPRSVHALADEFEAQNDYVSEWIAENCRKAPGLATRSSILFADYRDYCQKLRLPSPGKAFEFVRRLSIEPGIVEKDHSNVRVWKGIGLVAGAFAGGTEE